MSFLDKLFRQKKAIPASQEERVELLRHLVRLRLEHAPEQRIHLLFMGTSVENFSPEQLRSFPESVMLNLFEQNTSAKENGIGDEEFFQALFQTHSNMLLATEITLPPLSQPYTLERYVNHWFQHVREGNQFTVSPAIVTVALAEIKIFYGR